MAGAEALQLLLLASDAKRAEDLARLAERAGRVRVAGSGDAAALPGLVRRAPVDAVLADLSENAHAILDAFEALHEPRPALVACGPTDDGALLLRALRLGARGFLPSEVLLPDLSAALDRLVCEPRVPGPEPRRGAIVGVLGGKGGVGATLVACQLASALRHCGRRVAIVDLCLPLGDVDLHFDLRPRYSLADLAQRGEGFDAAYLQTLTAEHPGGVRVLAAPQDPEHAESVTAPLVNRALALLQLEYDFVVVDLARSWSEPVVQALELCDQILLVTLLDVPTLHHVRRQRAVLERLRIPSSRLKLIANRASSSDAVGDAELRRFLSVALAARLPNDYACASAAANQGVPVAQVAPGARLARAFEQLAFDVHAWCGVAAPERESRSHLPGWLRGLGSRRKNGAR